MKKPTFIWRLSFLSFFYTILFQIHAHESDKRARNFSIATSIATKNIWNKINKILH